MDDWSLVYSLPQLCWDITAIENGQSHVETMHTCSRLLSRPSPTSTCSIHVVLRPHQRRWEENQWDVLCTIWRTTWAGYVYFPIVVTLTTFKQDGIGTLHLPCILLTWEDRNTVAFHVGDIKNHVNTTSSTSFCRLQAPRFTSLLDFFSQVTSSTFLLSHLTSTTVVISTITEAYSHTSLSLWLAFPSDNFAVTGWTSLLADDFDLGLGGALLKSISSTSSPVDNFVFADVIMWEEELPMLIPINWETAMKDQRRLFARERVQSAAVTSIFPSIVRYPNVRVAVKTPLHC